MAKPGPVTDQEKLELRPVMHDQRQHNGKLSQKTAMPRWRNKGREKSSVALACTWVVDHQIGISVNLLGLLYSIHLFLPQARHYTTKFFRIAYYDTSTGKHSLGWDDIFFVFHWIIVFTGLRCIAMDYVLSRVAVFCGINKKKAKVRFVEQAWILLYYIMFWSTGMYIMYHSDYWLNLRALWRNWPVRQMDGLAKWYYLVQFAFWLQQIVVVNIEERRKDHWQMFTHHIVTCILIFSSYGYHQYKVGTLILCLMDLVDIIFAAAKLLKYVKFQLACDIMFGVFMVTWFITRHVMYMMVWYSIYTHIPQEIRFGCYYGSDKNLSGPIDTPEGWMHLSQPFRDPEGLVCWNQNISWFFLTMLGALQVIMLIWFVMIIKVAYRVLSGQAADDSRSDDEESEDEEIEAPVRESGAAGLEQVATKSGVIEKEFLSTELSGNFSPKARSPVRRSSRRREGGQSSGINVLGGSDRKELLGRIGCDRPAAD